MKVISANTLKQPKHETRKPNILVGNCDSRIPGILYRVPSQFPADAGLTSDLITNQDLAANEKPYSL